MTSERSHGVSRGTPLAETVGFRAGRFCPPLKYINHHAFCLAFNESIKSYQSLRAQGKWKFSRPQERHTYVPRWVYAYSRTRLITTAAHGEAITY